MRLIEKQMLDAVNNKEEWSKDNTLVTYLAGKNVSSIFLHGNHIALYHHTTDTLEPNRNTFKEWPTTTTRSRLNALGACANIRKFKACLDGVEL